MSNKPHQNISFPKYSLLSTLLSHLSLSISSVLSSPTSENTFDFIIVGGGTAGLVLARRLTEYSNFSVIVLESGMVPKEGSEIPAFAPMFIFDPDVTFIYKSTPQKNAGLRDNGIITVIAGRGVSGTSNLNYMAYNRGSPKDYDNWSNLTNDDSWNYSSMLKYFKTVENYRGDHLSDQHGFNGPLTISRPRWSPGLNIWLQAGKEMGYKLADPNGPQRISFSPVEYTKRNGRRVNSLYSYISPILSTSQNLLIFTYTNATKILFKDNRAVGVCYQTDHELLQILPSNCVYARKEIILSAGTYGSPLLLLRSGIGPKDSLREANIPVIKDLPVGLNFHDHVFVNIPFVLNSKKLVMDNDRDLNPSTFEFYKYVGDGPYSCTLGLTGQAFVASSIAKSERDRMGSDGDEWPDLHLILSHSKDAFFTMRLVNGTVNSWEGPMVVSMYMTRPKSRGSLRRNPNDLFGPPILDVGFFTDSTDMQRMLDGIDVTMKIFEETPAYQKVGARFPEQLNLPGCEGLTFRSKEFWECYVRYMSVAGANPAGTCRMSRKDSGDAVVDTKLKVIGMDGLRVVDASIMPVVTNANTQAPVYAIAEKAAEMILGDWGH